MQVCGLGCILVGPGQTDLFSGNSPSSGSTVAVGGSRDERVCGRQPVPEVPVPPFSVIPSFFPPPVFPPVPLEHPV